PGAAALLAQAESPRRMHVSILHAFRHNPFTDGARELFDSAAQGRIDTFFLGGVQIDGQANINLVGIGDYPAMKKRFPGSFGSALMYFAVPRVILFREEHSPRTLVERVDFISAPGVSEPGVWRPGGPKALVTNRAVFAFDPARARFRLESVHPGETPESVAEATGFAFDSARDVAETPAPAPDRLAILRREVAPKVAEFYPRFAAKVWNLAA
ncbi:MAG TPA: CoA-transferase, partial [Thermohalobaculum sp.]|nr:CoA-transferase [Thermohalobaculum sp.]